MSLGMYGINMTEYGTSLTVPHKRDNRTENRTHLSVTELNHMIYMIAGRLFGTKPWPKPMGK